MEMHNLYKIITYDNVLLIIDVFLVHIMYARISLLYSEYNIILSPDFVIIIIPSTTHLSIFAKPSLQLQPYNMR